jgi:hypothetical protein
MPVKSWFCTVFWICNIWVVQEELVEDKWISYISFVSDLVVSSEEYYIYNLNTLVASIGGGLGMFLGVSIFGIISKLLRPCVKNISTAQQTDEN